MYVHGWEIIFRKLIRADSLSGKLQVREAICRGLSSSYVIHEKHERQSAGNALLQNAGAGKNRSNTCPLNTIKAQMTRSFSTLLFLARKMQQNPILFMVNSLRLVSG
jgi:hypothetical protein